MKNTICLLLLITCINLGLANTYMWEDLEPPSASDVIAFSNEKPPPIGGRNLKEKTEILEYLRRGAVFYSKNALSDYIKDQDLPGVKLYDRNYPRSDGVIATKDNRIIYWTVMSEHVLQLETAGTEHCYLLYIDKWTQEAIDELKKYQYSNQAGRKRYTKNSEERMALLEINLTNLQVHVEDELKALENSYADFQSAAEEEKRTQFNAFISKRILVESLRNRIKDIEKELIPLKLEIQYPTPNYGFGTSSN